LVINWFNRRSLTLTGGNVAANSTSTTWVAFGTASLFNFLTWPDEAVSLILTGTMTVPSAGATISTGIGIDNVLIGSQSAMLLAAGAQETPCGGSAFASLTEGFHTATVGGFVSAGSGAWSIALMGLIRG
jgi:hypothetical protein